MNLELLAAFKTESEGRLEAAENGLVAAELVETDASCFDVVFMDMQMPELDGYGATARLRLGGFDVPIIALTAHAMPGDRQKCLDAGCNDYTSKPIDKKILIEMAKNYGNLKKGFTLPPFEIAVGARAFV